MFLLPPLKSLSLPKIKPMTESVEKLIHEGNYHPPEQEIFCENKGYWFNEFKKFYEHQDNDWLQAVYSRRISPYNRLDERRIVAEVYFDGKMLDVDVFTENSDGKKENYKKFIVKGAINENKLNQLFEAIEEKYSNILETREESEELRESFGFDKVMNSILEREKEALNHRKFLADATEESIGRKIMNRNTTRPMERVYFNRKIK